MGIEHGNEHITVFKYFQTEVDKHLMKYRTIYMLEVKYMIPELQAETGNKRIN